MLRTIRIDAKTIEIDVNRFAFISIGYKSIEIDVNRDVIRSQIEMKNTEKCSDFLIILIYSQKYPGWEFLGGHSLEPNKRIAKK